MGTQRQMWEPNPQWRRRRSWYFYPPSLTLLVANSNIHAIE